MNEQSEVEKLKRKVESLKKKLKKSEEEYRESSESDKDTIKRLMKTLEKTQLELAKHDDKRKEMNVLNCLHDAHKLIRRAQVLFDDPQGGPMISDKIEDSVYRIIKDLESLSIANRTINIVEVV